MIFSYGSGLCSTMMTLNVKEPLLTESQRNEINFRLQSRIKISPEEFTAVLLKREKEFGKFTGKLEVDERLLFNDTFYLE